MPSLCGKPVGEARRELLAADPGLTIAIDGSDDAIVHTQIPPADQPLCSRRQVRLCQEDLGEVEVPNLESLSVGKAYMVTGEARLDLLIADEDPSVPPRRPRARDANKIVVRHLDHTPIGRALAAGDAVVVLARNRAPSLEKPPEIATVCPPQTSPDAEPIPDFSEIPLAVTEDADEDDAIAEYPIVEFAMQWCGAHGLNLILFDAFGLPFSEGKAAGAFDKSKEVLRHHDCTPAGSRIKVGGTVGLVVTMPPAGDKLFRPLHIAAIGFGVGAIVGAAITVIAFAF